jgi:hypothetical protein
MPAAAFSYLPADLTAQLPQLRTTYVERFRAGEAMREQLTMLADLQSWLFRLPETSELFATQPSAARPAAYTKTKRDYPNRATDSPFRSTSTLLIALKWL